MKKKKKIQYSGKLKSYMQWPVIMVLFFLIMNVAVYFLDVKAGLVVSVFFVLYAVMVLVMRFHYRPSIMNEMISFATQYGQIQKTLLNEFSIPYAILDIDGRVIWMNEAFCKVVGKDKQYRKSIGGLFPGDRGRDHCKAWRRGKYPGAFRRSGFFRRAAESIH